jgi:hypothetical protein
MQVIMDLQHVFDELRHIVDRYNTNASRPGTSDTPVGWPSNCATLASTILMGPYASQKPEAAVASGISQRSRRKFQGSRCT